MATLPAHKLITRFQGQLCIGTKLGSMQAGSAAHVGLVPHHRPQHLLCSRRWASQPRLRGIERAQAPRSLALSAAVAGDAEPSAATGAHPAEASSPEPSGASVLDSIPAGKLKELRRLGLSMKDIIKLGRRGVGGGVVGQIFARWNTSEVRGQTALSSHCAFTCSDWAQGTAGVAGVAGGGRSWQIVQHALDAMSCILPDTPPVPHLCLPHAAARRWPGCTAKAGPPPT